MRVVGVTGDTSTSHDSWSFLGYAPLSTQPMFLFCSLIVLSIKGEKHSNIYKNVCTCPSRQCSLADEVLCI